MHPPTPHPIPTRRVCITNIAASSYGEPHANFVTIPRAPWEQPEASVPDHRSDRDILREALTTTPQTAQEIATHLRNPRIGSRKAATLLIAMSAEGQAEILRRRGKTTRFRLPIKAIVASALGDTHKTAQQIADETGLSRGRVSIALTALAASGAATVLPRENKALRYAKPVTEDAQ